MGIKRKEIDLLLELSKNPVSVRELSEKLDESERNLRYSIENLDYYLKIYLKSSITKNNKRLSALLTEEEVDSFLCYIRQGDYIYSIAERCEYILFNFLFEDTPKLKDIEEYLGVTRTTLKKDMRLLEEELQKYELEFIIEGNRVYIRGNEKKLRHLMMIKMMKYADTKKPEVNYPLEAKLKEVILDKNPQILKTSKKMLTLIEKRLNESFSKEFNKVMECYLWVTFFRIDKDIYIEKKSNEEFLRKTDQYKIIRETLEEVIPGHDYEALHLTEYFLSGSSEKEYYEERIAIELFTYEMLVFIGKNLEKNIFGEELFKEIVGYLTSAIYRMKNNFILRLDGGEVPGSRIYRLVEEVCQKDGYLSENLRREEIGYMARLVEETLDKDKDKNLDMKKILEIVRRNSKELDEKKIEEELLQEYERWIRVEQKSRMLEKEQLISRIKIDKNLISREEALEVVNKKLKEMGNIWDTISPRECEKSRIFREDGILCYYITSIERIKKSSIVILELERGDRVVFLALKDETTYLKALSSLRKSELR